MVNAANCEAEPKLAVPTDYQKWSI
jgi:hypothetical protein